MDDFEFPVLHEDEPIVDTSNHDGMETIPFHLLATLPLHQLPRTAPTRGGTLGGCIQGLINSKRFPVLPVALQHRVALPTSQPAAAGNTLAPEAPEAAQQPEEKYRWMPQRRSFSQWSDSETRAFYDALAQFGTDFTAAAVLFPHRTRADIVHKYKTEMKKRPDQVQSALLPCNQKQVDVEAFLEKKRESDALHTEPTRVLNAEEEAHLQAIHEALVENDAAAEGDRNGDGMGHQAASNTPTHSTDFFISPNTPSTSEFTFDEDEDLPVSDWYKKHHQKTSSAREDTKPKPGKRARSPSPVKRNAKATTASSASSSNAQHAVAPQTQPTRSPRVTRSAVKADPDDHEEFAFEQTSAAPLTHASKTSVQTAAEEGEANDLIFDDEMLHDDFADQDFGGF